MSMDQRRRLKAPRMPLDTTPRYATGFAAGAVRRALATAGGRRGGDIPDLDRGRPFAAVSYQGQREDKSARQVVRSMPHPRTRNAKETAKKGRGVYGPSL